MMDRDGVVVNAERRAVVGRGRHAALVDSELWEPADVKRGRAGSVPHSNGCHSVPTICSKYK